MDIVPIPTNIKDVKETLPQTVQAIDNALSSAVNLANICLTPIEILKAHSDYALAKTKFLLHEKLKNIPSEKIIPPAPYVAVPALQAISYSCDCDELHEMFASLLATAMNTDSKELAHPSFVEIIKQLSPTDAKVLNSTELKTKKVLPKCNIRFQNSTPHPLGEPFHNISGGVDILENLVFIEAFDYINDIPISFTNFYRLGIFQTNSETYLSAEGQYDQFKHMPPLEILFPSKYYSSAQPNGKLCLIPGMITLTPFGEKFREACVL